jgi:hypothetical protein
MRTKIDELARALTAVYVERGSTHFDQLYPQRTQKWLVKRLEQLGYQVHLQPLTAAA